MTGIGSLSLGKPNFGEEKVPRRWWTVLLRDVLWEIFRQTGHVEAYLMYRQCGNGWKEEKLVMPWNHRNQSE